MIWCGFGDVSPISDLGQFCEQRYNSGTYGEELVNEEFRLGTWLVHPSLNSISQNGVTVHLEPKVMEVLLRLAQQPGELVPKQKLLQDVWPDTFVTDDALKRCVSELRNALEDEAREPRIIETIPKRGYRLVVAPAEIGTPKPREAPTAESGPRGNRVPVGQEPAQRRRRWQLAAVAIVLIAATAVFTYIRYLRDPETMIDSIAVMPFVSKGMDANNDLGDGITAGLIESLSQIPNLKVISRSSISRYKGKEIEPRKIGKELNVRAVLTGSFAQNGETVVLEAELVNVSDETHVWGQRYQRKASEILELQSELAHVLSGKLRPHIASEVKAKLANQGTSDLEAYALYVKGRYSFDRWKPEHVKEALIYFQQAVEKDPTYAQAYAGMGDVYAVLTFFEAFPFEQGIKKAKAAAGKALELDPNLAEGHCALGAAAYIHYEWQLAETESRRCVELNPNLSYAHQWHAWTLASLGKMEQSVAEEKLALEVDPLSHTSNKFLATAYYNSRNYDQAIEQARKVLEIEPGALDLHDDLGNYYLVKGDYGSAVSEYEKELILAGKNDQAEQLRRAYARNGYRGLLEAQIKMWDDPKRAEDYDPYGVAQDYSLLGDRDNAFLWLDKSYGSGGMLVLKIDPQLDNIRSDPRFTARLRRMGLQE